MGWKGVIIGSCLGSVVGHGWLGSLLGAWIGNSVEDRFFSKKPKARQRASRGPSVDPRRAQMFCASASAILAKMAKADGRVTQSEIASVERAFRRLGFSSAARHYAISVFRQAKDDMRSIYDYARDFAQSIDSYEVLELFYELLWDLAAADGSVDYAELAVLRQITQPLGIDPRWYDVYYSERVNGGWNGGHRSQAYDEPSSCDELSEAYVLLGVGASASDDEVRTAYREKAKKYHPDALRAQGLPEEMLGRANERMARINAAWAKIKSARGL